MSLNNVIPWEAFGQPNVWSPRSVEEVPVVKMSQWQVLEVKREVETKRTRHLVGWAEGAGRVSSAVVKSIKENGDLTVTTSSGRKYLLMGPPGMNMDASYTKEHWLDIQKATDPVIVTEEYYDFKTKAFK